MDTSSRWSEQVDFDVGVGAAQSTRIVCQGGPFPGLGDVNHMPGATIKDVGVEEQLVDLAGGGGIEFAEHYRRVTEQFGEFRPCARQYRTHFGQCECRQIEREVPALLQPGVEGGVMDEEHADEPDVDLERDDVRDRHGNRITSEYLERALADILDEDASVEPR